MKVFATLLVTLTVSTAGVIASPAPAGDCNSQEAALRIARDAVAQREEWPHGGDYKVSTDQGGWRVTAWRIDFPNHEGSARYAGGGFRVIEIGQNGTLQKYSRQ